MNFKKLLLFLSFTLIYLFNLNGQEIENKKLDSILNYVNSEFTYLQKSTRPKKEIKFQRVTDSLLKLDLKDSILSELYFKKATLYRAGATLNYVLSEDYFKKAIELNYKNHYAYQGLGTFYERIKGDSAKSKYYNNKSLEINPDCTQCLIDNTLYYNDVDYNEKDIDNLVELIKRDGIDADYDHKIDDYGLLIYGSDLAAAYWDLNKKKCLGWLNYCIDYENKYLDFQKEQNLTISPRYKEFFGDPYRFKAALIQDGEAFNYPPLEGDEIEKIDFKSNNLKKEQYNLVIKNLDSAIVNRNKIGGNPSEILNSKLSFLYAAKNYSNFKEELKKLKALENFDFRKENYLNSLSDGLNQIFNESDFEYYYPYEKFNRRKDTVELPLYLDFSLNIKDISQLTLEGDYKDKFFIEYEYKIESKYEDLEYTKLSEYSDSLTFFNYSNRIETKQLELIEEGNIFGEGYEEYDPITDKYFKVFYMASVNPHVWEFSDFPFDKQKLNIKFESRVDTSFYRFKHSEITDSKVVEQLSLEEGYVVEEINFREEFLNDPSKDLFFPFKNERSQVNSVGIFEIIVSRKSIWVFLKLFLGAFLSYVLSCLVFLIPKSNFGSRIDLTIGAIFGSIGNKYFVESSTSMSQVMTKADMINNLVILLVLVNVVLVIMQDNDKFDFGKFENSNFSLVFSVFTMLILTTLIIVV